MSMLLCRYVASVNQALMFNQSFNSLTTLSFKSVRSCYRRRFLYRQSIWKLRLDWPTISFLIDLGTYYSAHGLLLTFFLPQHWTNLIILYWPIMIKGRMTFSHLCLLLLCKFVLMWEKQMNKNRKISASFLFCSW